ncbi:ankyrin repeat and SAM domain-containing protein 6-like [Apostichopus japonicus]
MDNGDQQELHRQLVTAFQQGDIDTLHQVLENQNFNSVVDIDLGEGFTPLHLAAGGGHENVVRLLLMRGAMLDSRNAYGWTPLMQAASSGHSHIAALLLQNKANLNTKNKLGASALTLASLGGHLSVVRLLVDYPGIDLNVVEIDGQAITPLMAAALNGYKSVMKLLIDRGADHFHVEKSTGWTNLMMVSLGGGYDAAQLLLDNGADPNTADINQRTALEIATLQDNKEVIELLEMKTTNRMRVADLEKTRIVAATEVGDEELVSHILDEDSSHCNVTSKDGATPLMIAAMLGHVTIAKLLIHKGADVNHKESKSGWTALMQATFHRKLEMVEYLVQVGADVTIQANDGCRALDLALVIINNENDKSGDELIRLLAPQTMPTSDHVGTIDPSRGYNGTSQIGTWDQDDSSKGGLKAWWSRMSNRFRKLKLTRTLRVGSSKLAPMESRSIPLDKTLILTDVGPGKKSLSDDGRLRRKSKDTKSVEFNLGNIARKDSGYGDTHSLRSLSTLPAAFAQTDSKLPSVIPPFLPPTAFEFQTSDRNQHHSQPSIKTMRGFSIKKTNGKPNKLLFTRRSMSGTSPSSSLHNGLTISPNSSGNSSTFFYGKITSGRLSSLPVLSKKDEVRRFSHNQTDRKGERGSDELARYQHMRSRQTASSTSSTLSGSVQPKKKSSRGTGSTTSTLTPPPSPTMQFFIPSNRTEVSVEHKAIPGSSSSGVSEEDELTHLLKKLSLERYAPMFEDQEVDMDAFLALNESDLLEMGIDVSGHRRQLMNVILKQN